MRTDKEVIDLLEEFVRAIIDDHLGHDMQDAVRLIKLKEELIKGCPDD